MLSLMTRERPSGGVERLCFVMHGASYPVRSRYSARR
jgi:hypothetical protein